MITCESCFREYDEKYDVCPYCGYYEGAEEELQYRLPQGTTLNNRYKVGTILGMGGFGITYKAWDTKLRRVVAIKEFYYADIVNRAPGTKDVVLVANGHRDVFISGRDRLLDEAKYVSRIENKKNIVEVYEYFEENNTSYMVMEYIKGKTLKEFVMENGKLSVEDAVNVISDICIATKIVHKNKILHKDLAPDNIMVTENFRKLLDFGAAKLQDGEPSIDRVVKSGFAPPEQYGDERRQGEWTDVYGLGATMYYALTGIRPQDAQDRKVQDKMLSPHDIDKTIPENISNAVMRAMALEIHMRFSDVEQFRKAICGEKKVLSVKEFEKRKKRRRFLSIAAALMIVSVGGLVFEQSYSARKAEAQLQAADITIWIQADDEDEKKNAIKEISDAFMQAYSNVRVHVVSMPDEVYEEKFNEAVRNNTLPEIFEIPENTAGYLDKTQNVSEIVKKIKDDIGFYEDILQLAANKKQLIIGFEMPVMYVNTTKYEGAFDDYEGIIKELGISNTKVYSDKDKFIGGEAAVYFGTSGDYSEIQAALPARYKMVKVTGELKCIGRYAFGLSDCRKNEKKAATRFLEYMYSDRAEDILFVQNNVSALPVNKSVLELYEQVYTEYEGFFNDIDHCYLEK